MEYDFNQLDPARFQRLINGILVARFGEGIRLTPLRGSDGGRDGETAPFNPYFEFAVEEETPAPQGIISPPRRGRYLFQVKHHRTLDRKIEDVRKSVLRDFRNELRDNVLTRSGDEAVNFFFLWTNVPSSEGALSELDEIRRQLLARTKTLHADIWWRERLEADLDQLPKIWSGFPEIFPGGQLPALAAIVGSPADGPSRAVRMALSFEYERDSKVKFRQIELEQSLSKLFVDLDIGTQDISEEERLELSLAEFKLQRGRANSEFAEVGLSKQAQSEMASRVRARSSVSGLTMLLTEIAIPSLHKVVLEGGPGQGKSTMTQMVAQIYRAQILGRGDIDPEGRWLPPAKARLPFRIELRRFGEWLSKNPVGSVEEYLVQDIRRNSGGKHCYRKRHTRDCRALTRSAHLRWP